MSGHSDAKDAIDPAALVGASVAGVLAVIVAEGPFNAFEVPIGLTLWALLLSYGAGRARSFDRSVVYAAASAFALYITIGWWLERFYAGERYSPDAKDGYIPHTDAAWCWFALFIVVLSVDVLYPPVRRAAFALLRRWRFPDKGEIVMAQEAAKSELPTTVLAPTDGDALPSKSQQELALAMFERWSNYLLVTTVASLGWSTTQVSYHDWIWRLAVLAPLTVSVLCGIGTLALVPLVAHRLSDTSRSIYNVAVSYNLWWMKPSRATSKLKHFCWPQHVLFLLGVTVYGFGNVLGWIEAK